MTVTQDASTPLFAVVGATGLQGRSVIDALKASKSPYRVRGLTRDTSKAGDLSDMGVEVVSADINDKHSLERAFKDAKYVFAMTVTDYSAWPGTDKASKCEYAKDTHTDAVIAFRNYNTARTRSTLLKQPESKPSSFPA